MFDSLLSGADHTNDYFSKEGSSCKKFEILFLTRVNGGVITPVATADITC